jgi:EAL domain-containing protein (putative c-di-GMP-specific phosphodiesterase class I)
MLRDPGRAREVITALRETGVAMSVDDFGTGYSSLAYLRDLPIDELKLDRSFVQTLAGAVGARDTAIVRSAVTLGKGLGLRVVAEGVEDADTLALLAELGFDEAQGYYLGRPVPAELLDLSSRDVAPAHGTHL